MSCTRLKDVSTSQLLGELVSVLDSHGDTYEEMCALLDGQQSALKTNDLANLEMLLDTQQEMVFRIAAAEEYRQSVQSELAGRLDIGEENLSLEELLTSARIPGSCRERLDDARRRVVFLTEKAQALNGQNRDLVHQALRFIAYSLSGVQKLTEGPGRYGQEGHSDGAADGLLIDRRY